MRQLVEKYFGFILIIVLGLVPLAALFNQGLPLTHDGQDHVARIANFYLALSEGSIVPRWAANLNWGYGHPILMFLYPMPSYLASLFHALGFPLVDAVKIVFGGAFIISGICMYLWLREFLGGAAGIAGGVLYMFAPYRFIDLYVRGAIGEHVAFIFPPLILFFLLKSAKNTGNLIYFCGAAVALAGLILSHNAISLMFLPFIIFYSIFLIWNSKNKLEVSFQHVGAVILGFCLSAFFWIPAFAEGKYTLRDIVTGTDPLSRFVSFSDLVYGPWNYGGTGSFSVQVGILHLLLVLLFPIVVLLLLKRNKSHLVFYVVTAAFFATSIFIMLPVSKPVWQAITTLQKFQFPWRFLTVSVFASAVLGAFFVYAIKKSGKLALVGIVLLALFLSRDYWKPRDYLLKQEGFYKSVYNGTTDTGESAPIWSVRFMEKRPKAPAEVIAGTGVVSEISRSSTHRKYQIDAATKIRVRENTLYFPGWRVYVDGERYNGVQFQDPANRGLMTYYVQPGKHTVDVVFKDTRLRTVASYITLASLAIIAGILMRGFSTAYRSRK